jgi:2-polyprenyl-6-hydroxyphenyl methylase/3-demethylubiquinone-9 3-methyltransferase
MALPMSAKPLAGIRRPLALDKSGGADDFTWTRMSGDDTMTDAARTTIDQSEVDRFSALAAEWWNPHGKFKPLHKFNPVRLGYIRDRAAETFGRDARSARPLEGLRLLDIGCGGGLLSEPMARMGAEVVGADASEKNIRIAETHAAGSGVKVDYRAVTAEALAQAGETFDIVLNMEVVEHVSDVEYFLTTCSSMVRPGGMMVIATINRTMKAAALAIFAAENVLRWLPRGTHQYEKLVRPEEIERPLSASGLKITERTGVFFSPFTNQWNLSKDMDVNYMLIAKRPRE